MDDNRFKGRKGQKRLREINADIDRRLGETEQRYLQTEEMQAIMAVLGDVLVKQYFVTAYHALVRSWHGMKTYGFLRLCRRWIAAKKITELTRSDVDGMLQDILPQADLETVRQAMSPPAED